MKRLLKRIRSLLYFFVWLVARGFYLAYLVVFRSFLYLFTAFVLIYFTVNSDPFRTTLEGIIGGEIPGAMTFETIEWGPVPWQVRVVGVQISEPDGTIVIQADRVYAEVDLLHFSGWLIPGITRSFGVGDLSEGTDPFRIKITTARVGDYRVLLDMREGGEPRLVRAFDDGEPSEDPFKESPTVEIFGAEGEGGTCTLLFPDMTMEYTGVSFGPGEVIIRDKDVRVIAPQVGVTKGWLRLFDGPDRSPEEGIEIPVRNVSVPFYHMERQQFSLPEFTADVSESTVVGQDLQLFFRTGEEVSFAAELSASIPDGDPMLTDLSFGQLEGPVTLWARGNGPLLSPDSILEISSPRLSVAGFLLKDLRLEGSTMQEGDDWRVLVSRMQLRASDEGRLEVSDAYYGREKDTFGGHVRLHQLSPYLVLTEDWLIPQHEESGEELNLENVEWLRGDLTGGLALSGDVDSDMATVDVRIDEAGLLLQRPASLFPERLEPLPLGEKVELTGSVLLEAGDEGTRIETRALRLSMKDADLEATGALDLDSGALSGTAGLYIANLKGVVRHYAQEALPVQGAIKVDNIQLGGTFLKPEALSGELKGTGLTVDGWRLGRVSGDLSLKDGWLNWKGLRLSGENGIASGDGAIELFEGSVETLTQTWPIRLSKLAIRDVPLQSFVKDIRGVISLEEGRFSGELLQMSKTFRGKARVFVDDVGGEGKVIQRAEARLDVGDGQLRLDGMSVVLASKDVVRAENVRVDLDDFRTRARVETRGVSLEKISAFRRMDIDMAGRVSGAVDVVLGPRWSGLDGTLNVTGFRFGGVHLGDASLSLKQGRRGRVSVRSDDFFEDGTLHEDSRLEFGPMGRFKKMWSRTAFTDIDVFRVLPGLAFTGGAARATGEVMLAINMLRNRPVVTLDFFFPDDGVHASAFDGDVKLANVGEFVLRSIGEGEWKFEHLLAVGEDRGVEVCGVMRTEGEQDLYVRLASQLDFLGKEKEIFSLLKGSIVTADNGRAEGETFNSCLPPGSLHAPGVPLPGEGALHITGPLTAPMIDGMAVLGGLHARVRTNGMDVRFQQNVPLRFSGEKEEPEIWQQIETDVPITGTVDDGSFVFEFNAIFDRWKLESVTSALDVVNFDYSISSDLRMRLNGEFIATGSELSSENPDLALVGDMQILEGSYISQGGLGRGLLSRTTGQRKLANYSKSIVETQPWLGPTALYLDVVGSNIEVQMDLPVGETEMELRLDTEVEGTLAEPEIYGRIDVLPGGRIRSAVIPRVFEVVKASVDFDGDPSTPKIEAEVQTEVTYQEQITQDPYSTSTQALNTFSGARPEEKTVVIRATIDGEANFDSVGREFEDMQLGLTSDSGAYGQAELIPLLVSGVPPGQGTDYTAFESGAQVPILVTEMSNLLTGTLLGAFVDDVSLGLRVEGGVDWGLKKSLGESFVFEVRGSQDATGQRVTPTFELKLSDRLSLEGSLRYFQDGTEGGDQIYETKLRYRIPLD